MKKRKTLAVLTALTCFTGTLTFGQGNNNPPPGFCNNVLECIEANNLNLAGLNCWDLNGNGVGDPSEDINNDGLYNALDCQGANGQDGADGMDGLNCWDLDGDGIQDPNEDINNDGVYDALDCQGAGSGGADFDWQVTGNNMQAIPSGNVGVGVTPSSNIKFYTSDNQDAVQIAGGFYKQSSANQVGGAIGVRGLSNNHGGSGIGLQGYAQSNEPTASSVGVDARSYGGGSAHYGMKSQATGTATNLGVGIQSVSTVETPVQYGVQTNSGLAGLDVGFNCGIRSIGYGNDISANGGNYGIHVTANPGTMTATNIGVYARASRPPSNVPGNPNVNYAIYGYADNDGVSNRAGYFLGDVEITGTLFNPSDEKLKNDIKPVGNKALDLIVKLEPKTYTYRQDIPEFNLPKGNQYGFIAQELEKVFPNFVSESIRPAVFDDEGNIVIEAFHYKTVNYINLIPVLTQAVKEQQIEIEKLKAEKEELEVVRDELNALKNLLAQYGMTSAPTKVEINGVKKVILNQNSPNPFSENTSISYFVPDHVNSASIIIYDMNGKKVQEVKVSIGFGTLDIYADDLANGNYTYAIIADGEVLESRKMIVNK